MLPGLFLERFPIEHVPLRTALDDPTRVGGQLGLDLSIDLLFLRQLGCEYSFDLFQDPPFVCLYCHQRAFLDHLKNDVGQMADFVFAQHTGPYKDLCQK